MSERQAVTEIPGHRCAGINNGGDEQPRVELCRFEGSDDSYGAARALSSQPPDVSTSNPGKPICCPGGQTLPSDRLHLSNADPIQGSQQRSRRSAQRTTRHIQGRMIDSNVSSLLICVRRQYNQAAGCRYLSERSYRKLLLTARAGQLQKRRRICPGWRRKTCRSMPSVPRLAERYKVRATGGGAYHVRTFCSTKRVRRLC